MGHKRLPEDKVVAILKGLFIENKGCTQLALEVLGRKSRESSVRHIKNVYEKYGNYFGVSLDGGDVKVKSKQKRKHPHPKVLLIDLETAPCKMYGWSLWNQNFGLNQVESEWFILSYCAKWLDSDDVIYNDLKGKVDTENDYQLLSELWELMNEADIVVGQNHRRFDIKKLNARLIMNGFRPYSPVKTEDTLDIAKRKFGFTSNKLEWMTDKLCVEFKKQKHGQFAGFELWKQCLLENEEAWLEMKNYNIFDVLSLEELWLKLRAWDDRSVNYALYLDDTDIRCTCGSTNLVEDGFAYTSLSKFQQYRCEDCHSFVRGRVNLFSKEKRTSLLMNVTNR